MFETAALGGTMMWQKVATKSCTHLSLKKTENKGGFDINLHWGPVIGPSSITGPPFREMLSGRTKSLYKGKKTDR